MSYKKEIFEINFISAIAFIFSLIIAAFTWF